MTQNREKWMHVEGWPGYGVSSLGRVCSWKHPGPGRMRVIDFGRAPIFLQPDARNGYLAVTLAQSGKKNRRASVHVLVLEAFVGPRPARMHGCHLDGDRRNNRLENLRWASARENNAHKFAHGTTQRGERAGTAKLTARDVAAIRRLLRAGHSAQRIARRYGVHRNSILNIKIGKTWAKANPRPGDYEMPT